MSVHGRTLTTPLLALRALRHPLLNLYWLALSRCRWFFHLLILQQPLLPFLLDFALNPLINRPLSTMLHHYRFLLFLNGDCILLALSLQ